VRPSLGVHLVLPRSAIELHTALIARTPSSVLFMLPWADYWLVGTTDTPWDGERDEPRASAGDVDYLLDQANRWLVRQIDRRDVIGVYAGLRPLATADAEPGDTARISREHLVSRPVPGLVTIVGGKYTTYRVMAQDTIDVVAGELPDPVPVSRTAFVPLVGAAGFRDMYEHRAEIAEKAGLPVRDVGHLLGRHGSLTADVLALIEGDPALGRRIHPGAPYLAAELVYAVENEDARHLDDLLSRRTRLALETVDHAASVAGACARLVGPLLGWGEDQIADELAAFEQVATAYAAGL
jgi:glycerol-3-phosphate dehydrogenase